MHFETIETIVLFTLVIDLLAYVPLLQSDIILITSKELGNC